MNKNMNMNKNASPKKPLFDRRGKSGIYSVVLSLILLAVLVVVNMLVDSLPAKYTLLDTTAEGQYEISGTTESFLAKMDTNVTIYYVVPEGYENSILSSFLERYVSMTPKLSLKYIDPLENPAFLDKYPEFDELAEESVGDYVTTYLLIESNLRYRVLHTGELYTYAFAELGASGLSLEEASQIYEQYYYYGIYPTEDGYCFDSGITGAVEYVCAAKIPSVYVLNGHGEEAFSDSINSTLSDYGIKYSQLNLALESDGIPEDCACIIINKPASDMTAAEAAKLSAYVSDGGNIYLMTDKNAEKLTNLMSLTSKFGLTVEAGTVNEGDSSKHVAEYPGHIYPTLNSSHSITSPFLSYRNAILLSNAQSIKVEEVNGYKTTELFVTSDKAYVTVSGEKGEAGKKVLSAIAEGDDGKGKFLWVASAALTNDGLISSTQSGNLIMLFNMANTLMGDYISVLPEIESVSMNEMRITTTETDVNIWGTILIFVIPGAILAGGLGYTIYRRRR
ncbi:MAG: Gldg family protein [Clostridia bacterium]|nr:Gldg family protein [Clostridia bacterium]